MPDLNSPVMNHPHSARDRTTPLFEGLIVNSGDKQQNRFFTQDTQSYVQENLQKNLFKNSKNIANMDNVPQSPVTTPSRKGIRHRSPSPMPQRYEYAADTGAEAAGTEVDYSAPSEEFELFDTLWQVYWTEEGYAYYLDSQTQHSQWDDPRTHGLLQYDEVTGELITDNTSTQIDNADDDFSRQDNKNKDEIMLALQQQDSFLQPKTMAPKNDFSPQKLPGPKRVQSMKPQKITANSADLSPFKTDNSDDDSNSDADRARFTVPARGSRSSQLRNDAILKKKKAFGTPEKNSSSDEESDGIGHIPRMGTRTRKEQGQRRREVESESDEGGGGVGSVSEASEAESDNSELTPQHKPRRQPRKILREDERSDQEEVSEQDEQSGQPKLRKKTAPKGPRNIPFLSESDMAAYNGRRSVEDKELEKDSGGGTGAWFTSGGGSDGTDCDAEDKEDELDLSETVSRMVQPPHGIKPIKTNCFSPDKASLQRAEQLKRQVSSTVSSPSRSCSSDSTGGDERNKSLKYKTNEEDLENLQSLPDDNQVLVGNMQLESDNDDDDDDFFDTIITMKKDELASTEQDVNSNSSVSSDYLKFLSKVENDVKLTPQKSSLATEHEEVSLAVEIDTSDWDEEMEKQHQLAEMKSAEKEKQMQIFDTSEEGGYGNGGNTLQFDAAVSDATESAPTTKNTTEAKPVSLHVDTEFPKDTKGESPVRPLKSGGQSPFIKSDHGSPNLEVRVQPYLDFLEAGNSVRQVRRQMEKDNQSKELIKLMIQMSDDVSSTPASSRPSSTKTESVAPSKATPEELSALKKDPSIGKYIKMAAMGVPFGNVEHKMKSEGVSADDMLRAAIALGHASAPPPAAVTASLSSTGGSVGSSESRPTSRRSSSVSLVKMHWNTVPADKLQNSIWANNDEDSMEEKEMQELEKLFAASGNAPTSGGSEGKVSSAVPAKVDPRMQLLVLDPRRAQNIVIGLSQYKGQKSHKQLLEAVCRLDDLDGGLNIDKLQNLMPLLPTLHEAKKMAPARGSQHPAEVFFNTAIIYYPELLKRLDCFVTCLTFADTAEGLLAKMKRIIEACNEVGKVTTPQKT
jgi:hypothetical protein